MKYDFTNTSTGEIVWQGKSSCEIIDKTMKYNDCLITKKTEIGDNQFYDQTVYSKNSGKKMIARKAHLPVNRYGGYSGKKAAYFAVINYLKPSGKKRISRNWNSQHSGTNIHPREDSPRIDR